MAKYHINPSKGPMLCRAQKQCPYGSEEVHYSSKEAAQEAFEKQLSSENPTVPAFTRKEAQATYTPEEFAAKVDTLTFEEIEDFANASPANHAIVDKLIDTRAEEAVLRAKRLAAMDPTLNAESECDRETYKGLKKEFNEYKNKTAALVEAHTASPHYKPASTAYPEGLSVGSAVEKTAFEPHTLAWHGERFDSVGGSDVACLAVMDFAPAEDIHFWDRAGLKKVEASKTSMPTEETVRRGNAITYANRGGALYRGTVWEDRLRDRFVQDHPELSVYHTKAQYANADRPWQQVNFDAVVSDRADGKPNGILEIKTGNDPAKWENGVPLNYRAQVLYYLNSTGFDYAQVGVGLNDGEVRYYKLHRNDPVAPGTSITMETYIRDRVEPWFEGLKQQR